MFQKRGFGVFCFRKEATIRNFYSDDKFTDFFRTEKNFFRISRGEGRFGSIFVWFERESRFRRSLPEALEEAAVAAVAAVLRPELAAAELRAADTQKAKPRQTFV